MEHFVDFIIWAFTVLGITTIITTSRLMHPIRLKIQKVSDLLGVLVTCPSCFGFWAALTLSLVHQSMTGNIIFDAFLGSGLMWYMIVPAVDHISTEEVTKTKGE